MKKGGQKRNFSLEIFGSGKGRFCLNLKKKKIQNTKHKIYEAKPKMRLKMLFCDHDGYHDDVRKKIEKKRLFSSLSLL